MILPFISLLVACSKSENNRPFSLPPTAGTPIRYLSYTIDNIPIMFSSIEVLTSYISNQFMVGVSVNASSPTTSMSLSFGGSPFQKGSYTILTGIEQVNSTDSIENISVSITVVDTIVSIGGNLEIAVDSIDYSSVMGKFTGFIIDQKGNKHWISNGSYCIDDPAGLLYIQ